MRTLQLERLRWSLQHAYDHVEHYRKKFDAAGRIPLDKWEALEEALVLARTAQTKLQQMPGYHCVYLRDERIDAELHQNSLLLTVLHEPFSILMEWVEPRSKKGRKASYVTGKNDGTNVGPGAPTVHFHQHRSPEVEVRLILKGGGCENVGAQYSLPDEALHANRDLKGCRAVILDAIIQAQGKGCGPGILGVCIGGDRATGYEFSKQQFLRLLSDRNPIPELDKLEQDILLTANELGIGPMGFGGKTTLLGVKICAANRLPASFFVSVSYMCWAYRRQGIRLDEAGQISQWLY